MSAFAARLCQSLGDTLTHSLSLITVGPSFDASVEGIEIAAKELATLAVDVRTTGTWGDQVEVARALDRVLALLSTLEAEFCNVAGCTSYDDPNHSYNALRAFADTGAEGTRLLRELLDEMARLGPITGNSFYSSGPISEVVAGRGFEAYAFGTHDPRGRELLLGGIVADLFDLLDDVIGRSSPYLSATPAVAIAGDWDARATALGFSVPQRDAWDCGELLAAADFAARMSPVPSVSAGARTGLALAKGAIVAEAQVDDMRAAGAILGVPWWDGTHRYPAFQISGQALRPMVASLISRVDFAVVSPISLAIWLGFDDGSGPRYERLDTAARRNTLQVTLQDLGVIKATVPQVPVPTPPIAEVTVLTSELPRVGRRQQGRSSKLAGSWHSRRGVAVKPVFYRITDEPYTPMYFASLKPGQTSAGGRFDLPDPLGTCYFSLSEFGAYGEVFRRLLVLDIQQASSRIVWELSNFKELTGLLDLKRDGARLGMGAQISTSTNRPRTQSLADRAQRAGYSGIVHTLNRTGEEGGHALFGPAGPSTPEAAGLGRWHGSRHRIADRSEFWKFVVSGDPIAMFNQLPLSKIA